MVSPKKAHNFVERLSLDEPPRLRRINRGGSAEQSSIVFRNDKQAVVVGSQIAEFASNVPAEIRQQISNSILLAQLAANKAVKNSAGTSAVWRESYRTVLLSTGWLFEGSSVGMQEIKKSNLEVHKAIIPVLTALLGPAVAATALVTTILSGLAEMKKDTPWITLFNRESRRASVSQFQVGYVQAPEGAAPRMSIIFFELDVTGNATQVLFFKFSSAQGTLSHSHTDLSVNPSIFAEIDDAVKQKVAAYALTFIQRIEI